MAYNIKGDLHVNRHLTVSGNLTSNSLSGSLTRLIDGSSYLIAGTNITLSTGSNGAVTINSTGGGGPDSDWIVSGSSLYTTSSVIINQGTGSIVLENNRILFSDRLSSEFSFYSVKASDSADGNDGLTKTIYLEAGNVALSGSGGAVWLRGGNAGAGVAEFGSSPAGGSIFFQGGSAAAYSSDVNEAAGSGGGFTFYGATGGSAITGSARGGTGGAFSVAAGSGGSSTSGQGGPGGDITFSAGGGGTGGSINGNGGSIQFSAGQANTGGIPGNVRIYAGRAFTSGFDLEDTGKVYISYAFSPVSDGGSETGNSDEFLIVSGTITTGSEAKYASFRGSIKTSGSVGFSSDTYLIKDGNDLKFFDTSNPGGYSLTELAAGGGGGGAVSSSLYRTQIVDYATTNAVSASPEAVGQVIFNASEFAGTITLRAALANANSTTTSSIKLFNVTSGAYVILTGSSEQIDHVGLTPAVLTSDNLRNAINFSTGLALYELQLFTSNAANAAIAGGVEFRTVAALTTGSPTRLNLGTYTISTATDSNPQACGGGYFVPTEHSPTNCTFRAILSTTTGSNMAFVQLYNITSGALVHIGGAGITELSSSNTAPTTLSSVNLYSATNFNTSNASVYEVRIFGSGSSPVTNLMNSEMVCS